MTIRHWITLVAVALAIGVANPAAAMGGCRQAHESTDILEPGCVVVTRDIQAAGPPAIVISVENDETVVIDLCGKKITQATTSTPAIFVASGGRVVIKNGTIEGGSRGIDIFSSGDVEIDELHVSSNTDAGINRSGGDDTTITNSSFEFIGNNAINVINSNTLSVRLSDMSSVGGNGIYSEGTLDVYVDGVRISGAGQTGVNVDGSGRDDASATLSNVDVTDAASGINIEGLNGWRFRGFGGRNLTGSAVRVVDSTGGSADDVLIANVGGDGVVLENSSGNSVKHVRGDGIAGNGLVVDGTSSDNFFNDIHLFDLGLDGFFTLGTNNWFESLSANQPGGCPFHFSSTAAGNLARAFRAIRSAGLCTCPGEQTGGTCDEGTDNLIEEVAL